MQWWLQTQGVVHVHSVYKRSEQLHLENYQYTGTTCVNYLIYTGLLCQYSGSKVVTCHKIISGLGSNDKNKPLENDTFTMIGLTFLCAKMCNNKQIEI